jgi:hypothetical protein
MLFWSVLKTLRSLGWFPRHRQRLILLLHRVKMPLRRTCGCAGCYDGLDVTMLLFAYL